MSFLTNIFFRKLKISCEEEFAFMRGNNSQVEFPRLTFESHVLLETGRTPVLSRVDFHVVARKHDGEVFLGPSKYVASPAPQGVDTTITVPPHSDVGKIIRETALGKSGAAVLEVSVTIHIPKVSFDLGRWIYAAPPPTMRDYRFVVLDDPYGPRLIPTVSPIFRSQHDVVLRCTNGVLPCSRAALFQVSGYFRRLFHSRASEFEEDCSLAGLTAVIAYMLTGSFSRPEPITPRLVEEMAGLLRRYRPAVVRPLFSAIEQAACEQLEREADNLEQVIKWYLVGGDWDMYRLDNAALAVLLTRHMNDFAMEFIVNEPGKPQLRELHERLTQRRNIFRVEPMVSLLLPLVSSQPTDFSRRFFVPEEARLLVS